MGKPEASVVGPAMVRPPRPASRERSPNGTPEPSTAMPLDTEVVVIHPSPDEAAVASEPHHEPPVAAADSRAPRRTGSVPRVHSPDAVTVPLSGLTAALAQRLEPRVLDLPVVALEKPSALLEPTPSPLPRVSLVPATHAAAADAPLASLNSRNVPTVAARYVAPDKPLQRKPAAAVTFPPARPPREGRIARRLAADVRSSKREIVLGLTIGMALAAALGLIGQRYLVRHAPAGAQTPAFSSATPTRSLESAPTREDWTLRPQPSTPSAASPAMARAPAAALEKAAEPQAPSSGAAETPPARVKAVRRKAPARSALPPAPASPADPFSDAPRGPAEDAWSESTTPRPKAPPSPAESAGLGMDLTL